MFLIKAQRVIITPRDYLCFYKMMESVKRQSGMCFFPLVIMSSAVSRWRIYTMMLLLSCRAARKLLLVSTSIWNQLMDVIWMQLGVNCAHRGALRISVGVKNKKKSIYALNTAWPQAVCTSVGGSLSQTRRRVVCWKPAFEGSSETKRTLVNMVLNSMCLCFNLRVGFVIF